MTNIQKERLEETITLIKAIRFNTEKTGSFKVLCNKENQLEKYRLGMTQLTLPARFGMYRNQTRNLPKKTEVELEDPSDMPASSSSSLIDPNHKRRNIFD